MSILYCPIGGKVSYVTRNDADKALKAIQSSPRRRRKHSGVYLCELGCGHYHITENLDERGRIIRQRVRAKRRGVA